MNITKENCDAWKKQPLINPITKRKITQKGSVYKQFEQMCNAFTKEDCSKWKQNPLVNPKTNRRISMTTKNGIYAQLVQFCKIIDEQTNVPKIRKSTRVKKSNVKNTNNDDNKNKKVKKTVKFLDDDKVQQNTKIDKSENNQVVKISKPKNKKIQKKTNSVPDNVNYKRQKLAESIKKIISPLLSKGNSTYLRSKFALIIRKYLKNLTSCINVARKKLSLVDIHSNPIVQFDKQIGTKSLYGMAYMNMGLGFAKLFKFSIKLMAAGNLAHVQEVEILKKMSKLIENHASPNMPITYVVKKCEKACRLPACPLVTQKNGYFVVINELASYDLQTFFKKEHDIETYESIVMQVLMALHAFHNLGYSHNDAHLGNYLIHEIEKGGCWRYTIDGKNIYIPNKGYLLVLWDPGLATKGIMSPVQDYLRTTSLITYMRNYNDYNDLIWVPPLFGNEVLYPIYMHFYKSRMIFDETKILSQLLDLIKNKTIDMKSIVIDETPPDYLINVKPYTMKISRR